MKCKERIMHGYRSAQCSRNAARDGWCTQHHPETVKERRRKQDERYEKQRANSPVERLRKALDKNKQLRVALEYVVSEIDAMDAGKKTRRIVDIYSKAKQALT